MPPLRLLLFGPPRIAIESGDAAPLPAERRHQLIVWLALKRAWVGRPELASLLWPEQESRLAFTNLRKALHRLQGTSLAAALETQGQALRLAAASDVADFEAALVAGRTAEALALHTGELLEGYDNDGNESWTGWLQYERERLRSAWRAAALTHLDEGALDAAGAIALSTRLLAADALDEAALAAHMRALARAGQPAAARQAWRAFAERQQAELGIAPGAALKALHDGLQAGSGIVASGPNSSADAASARPPAPTDDGFVGRTSELKRIAELLAQPDCALLCLIGPGGVGKTSLARRAMREMAGGFADGATFVPLEDVSQLAELGPRLATELGLPLSGQVSALDQVKRGLAQRHMLLVLDNFEQLAEEGAWLESLKDTCPRLKVLITSRVRPAAPGTWTLPLEGLPFPEADDVDRLEAFDAARLFVRAAQRVEPALVATAEAAAIAEICRLVEGLPLALELAASFTRVLSCEAIAEELRSGTELLRATDPGRPARQASIEAVFEQSWRHLVPAEREGLMRLALFRGGFTAAAARSVAAASLPVLAALADKSLLRKEGPRCHLHPLVQQLALARLGSSTARETTAAAHSRHFLRLLAELRRGIRHAEREVLRTVDNEFENIRAAWRWAAAHGPGEDLARAAPSLMDYCDHRGRWNEGLALLRESLADAPTGATGFADLVTAALAGSAAHLEHRLDRYAEAEALATRALAIASKHGNAATQLQCVKVLGATCLRLARLPEARRWYQRALELAREIADASNVAGTLDNLALLERNLGHVDESLRLSHQALLQHREIGDVAGEAMCLNNLSVVHVLRADLDAAREVLQAARLLCERHGLPTTRSMVEANLADLAYKAGDMAALLRHANAALELSRAAGQRAIAITAHMHLMYEALHRRDLPAARAQMAAGAELTVALGRPVLKVNATYVLAELLAAQGDEDCACRLMAFALQQPFIVGADRDRGLTYLRAWGGRPDTAWTGPPLDELMQRIVVESALAYAPLMAQLRSTASAS